MQSVAFDDPIIVRDSAGIKVVEHSFPLPRADMACLLSQQPDLVIGAVEGSGPEVFGRIGGVTETPNSMIVVADALAMELRAFDSSGAHVWTTGGEGEGPRELRSISALAALAGDSIAVFDARARRVSIFDGRGGFARSYPVPRPEGTRTPSLAGVTGAGGLAALAPHAALAPREAGPFRRLGDLLFYDGIGSLSARHSSMLEVELVMPATPRGPVAPLAYLPLGRRTTLAGGRESVVVATQERFEFRRYRPSGDLEEIVRVDRPVSLADLDRFEASGGAPPHGFFSDSLPALARIQLDETNRVWVEEYVPPYEDRVPMWWVFGPGGSLVASASIPVGFSPRVISAGAVLGIVEDDLGVGYVQRRRLICQATALRG